MGMMALLVVAALLFLVYPNRFAGDEGATWRGVPTQYDAATLGETLADAGLLQHPRLFSMYLRLTTADTRLRSHEVFIASGSTPLAILRKVSRGFGAGTQTVLVREGLTRFETAALLEAHGVCAQGAFLQATSHAPLLQEFGVSAQDAEGYLFPDTYQFSVPSDPYVVVRRMLGNFARRTKQVRTRIAKDEDAADVPAIVHDVITLASIVEKEAKVPSERGLIAGVFSNRLQDPSFLPKRLQADPTVAYGCAHDPTLPSCRSFDGRAITKEMLRDRANPYNTYRHEGLPPGPISNPGLAAIEAAFAPTRHGDLYFVARGDGAHVFAKTLAEHNQNVKRYRSQQALAVP